MKTAVMTIFFTFVLSSMSVWASASYEGPFSIDAARGHRMTISGKMVLPYEGGVFQFVELYLNEPVRGQNSFTAKEQWAQENDQALYLVFQLERARHRWYFVLNAKRNGNELRGNIFKVRGSLDEIRDTLLSSDSVPADWKLVGSADLK